MAEQGKGPGMPPLVGAHMSISGGAWKAFARGTAAGCTAMQIFTKNASRWEAPPLDPEGILLFRQEEEKSGLTPVFAHDAYLINMASPSEGLRKKSCRAFLDEMERAEKLGLAGLVMHPGAHKESGVEEGIRRVAESINWVHERTPGSAVTICLENTAGQGTLLAGDFSHLEGIFSGVREADRLGICFDTCHAFAAGYELRTPEGYEKTMSALEAAVGRNRVRIIHTNDAKGELGGRLDRHAHLGRGRIGLGCFRFIMNDLRFDGVPKILETPKEEDGLDMDRVNLGVLRALRGKSRVPPRLLERIADRVRGEAGDVP
jgi:deoxyribonuclease-4